MQGVLRDVKNLPEVILFIDELHTIIGAGATGQGASDAAQILKPSLARGDLHLVGATTLDEYVVHLRWSRATRIGIPSHANPTNDVPTLISNDHPLGGM